MKIKFLFLWLIIFSLLMPVIITSCTPKYSIEATQQAQDGWKATDALYEKIMQSNDKTYDAYSENYLSIFSSISVIESTYAKRKHTNTMNDILHAISNRLAKYEAEHRAAGSINNSMASIYKRNMDALWRDYYNAESRLNK